MLIGYARVSTPDQDLALQMDALTRPAETYLDRQGQWREHRTAGSDRALGKARKGDKLTGNSIPSGGP